MFGVRLLALIREQDPIPKPFLTILVVWLTVLFGGIGLVVPRKGEAIRSLVPPSSKSDRASPL